MTRILTANAMLDAALRYAQMGVPVFPLYGIRNHRCTCGGGSKCTPGKHPRTPNGFKDATTDAKAISDWWERWPDSNIGVPTGQASGWAVVDIDPRNGGDESLSEIQGEYGALPETVEAITGGGGQHIVFAYPGTHLPCRAGLRPGIDLKADGGYIVVEPSNHASGNAYTWELSHHVEEVPLQPMPAWLISIAREERCAASASADRETEMTEKTETTEPYGSVISAFSVLSVIQVPLDAAQSIAEAIEGSVPRAKGIRNDATFDFARRLHAIQSLNKPEPTWFRPIVRLWHHRAYPVIGTKAFEDTWADFLHGYPRVKFPKGQEPMAQIIARADAAQPPRCCADYESPQIIRLITICRAMQDTAGERPFFLSCRLAGQMLGIDRNAAAKLLFVLCADRIIQIVEAHTATRATRYRYVATN
jgi:hypothetical protein